MVASFDGGRGGRFRRHRCAFGKDRGRAAREDDRLRCETLQEGVGDLLEVGPAARQLEARQLRHVAHLFRRELHWAMSGVPRKGCRTT